MKTQNKKRNSWRTMISFTCIMAILSLVLVFTSTTAEAAGTYDFEVIGATSDFYVNDFAGLFTEQQKADMMEMAVALDKEYGGIQVVVTTVESLADCTTDGKAHDIMETSYAMYNQYGIGEDSMGILILFSSGDRDVWMQTGYEMQAYITDSKSGQLLDNYGMDYFRNDLFAEGLVSLQKGTIDEIKSIVPQDWNAPVAVAPQPEKKTEDVTVAGNANATKTNNDSNKKSGGIGGWLYAIFAAFFAMIVGLGVTIKGLFTSKSKAAAQKKETEKKLQEQVSSYEQKISSLRSSAETSTRRAVDANSETWKLAMQQQKSAYETKVSDLESRIETKNANIQSLEKEVSDLNTELHKTNQMLADYKDKYERSKMLHPDIDFDKEVLEMIENEFRASAREVDKSIAHYANLSADKDSINVFSEAIRVYDTMTSDVQKYMTTDINKLRSLCEESVSLKREYERAEKEKRDRAAAQKAFESINAICSGISCGNHENYETLNRAYRIYSDLTSDEKGYYPNIEQIHTLESLRRTAEADLKDFNKAHEAEKDVRRIVDRIYNAGEGDRDNLERALRYYTALSRTQQNYFSHELARKVKRMLDEAEDDHRRKEEERRRRKREEEERRRRQREEEECRRRQREEEERRRRMSSSSSFSSHSHSSFGGHGGRASGGGAGRHF